MIEKPPTLVHAFRALRVIVGREVAKFVHQRGRLLAALIRPALWLVAFAAGFQNVFGVSIIPPYRTYITYQEYMVPGLVCMIVLFNGMQSSLSLVYDREIGTMRLLLTAPLRRWYLLFCKLIAGVALSALQVYAFLLLAWLFGVHLPGVGYLRILPAVLAAAFLFGSIGLLLSVHVRMLENFAGTMNFVIFPMFFLSSALYPLWKLKESGANYIHFIAALNPFTHAVELVRFAAYGQLNLTALAVIAATTVICFLLAVMGYDAPKGPRRLRSH